MTNQTSHRICSAVLALAAMSAAAQPYPILPPISQSYVPLVGAVTAVVSDKDDGYATIALGFGFSYYGQTYTTVHVNTNGFLAFGNTSVCEQSVGCYNPIATDGAIPRAMRSDNIHNLIAPWWDDLWVDGAGTIRSLQSSGQIQIEFSNVRDLSSTYTMSFTVKLTSTGSFEIHYGSFVGTLGSASMGFENATGTAGAPLLACSAVAANCAQANWPTNTRYVIGQPQQADIVVHSVTFSNQVVDSAGNVSLNLTATLQNYGQMAASPPFAWKAYLSTDTTLGGDILVHTAAATVTLTSATALSGSTTMVSAVGATLTPPGPAQYYVLVEADSSKVVTEASELNNVGSSTSYFVNGIDLIATEVSNLGAITTGPGNPMSVNVKWTNLGTIPTPSAVNYRILVSTDAIVGTTDFAIYAATRAMAAGEVVNESLSFNVPNNVPGGDFFLILQIDPGNAIVEANEANNVSVSAAKVTMKQADLVNLATHFVDAITRSPTRIGYFGEAARATVSMSNIGGANASNFKVAVVISTDASLSLLSDTIAFEADVALVAQTASLELEIPFTMPLKDRANLPFATGHYYIFTILDSTSQVTELIEANNNLAVMGTVLLRAPAPDLTVTRVDTPATGAVGEIIQVMRTFKNIGNVAAATARYRYFASANTIITPDDVPLEIIRSGTPALDGVVTLAIGESDTQAEVLRLPATMPSGTYFVGAIIDTDAAIAETDELNNSGAATAIQVAASSLRVSTEQVPDAIVDRPYGFRLVARGEQGLASTWALEPNQGALPAGMSLAADGQLSGTPTSPSVTGVTVVVTNNGRHATARLVLRALPATTQVEITTVWVPVVINLAAQKYEFALGAAGGVKPYSWKIVTGLLPAQLVLSSDGVISGLPRSVGADGASNVLFEVRDSLGTRAQKSLSIRVIASGSIVLKNLSLPDGLVGVDYGTDVAAQNGDLSVFTSAQKPLVWTLQGELPDGLKMKPSSDVLLIEGTPQRAGLYSFTLIIEDAKGRTDTAEFRIRIYPSRFKLGSVGLPDLARPGDTLAFGITATSQANPTFSIYAGQLPRGLTLAPDGKITGTIPNVNSSEGTYNFAVDAIDAQGATGLGAFSLEVKRAPAVPRCGCNSALDGVWLLALLMPFALRRKGVCV